MCLPVQLTLQTRTDFKELQYGTHDAADYKQNTVSCHKYRNSRNVVATREPGMDQVPQPCATQALTRADFLTSTFWQRGTGTGVERIMPAYADHACVYAQATPHGFRS
eukprot:5660204-Pleurochrysis_carterae.AAC.1